jgi:hypothetical protein
MATHDDDLKKFTHQTKRRTCHSAPIDLEAEGRDARRFKGAPITSAGLFRGLLRLYDPERKQAPGGQESAHLPSIHLHGRRLEWRPKKLWQG